MPRFASQHAAWLGQMIGSPQETGSVGWFFLQRLGTFVDAHLAAELEPDVITKLRALSEPDAKDVEQEIAKSGLPPAPPPEWPGAEKAVAAGKPVARIGIIGDPHVGLEAASRTFPAVLRDVAEASVDAAVVIGDITQDGRVAYYETAKRMLADFAPPTILTLGNHDMWGGGTPEAVGLDRFVKIFGLPSYGTLEVGGVTLIVINSADPSPSRFPPFDLTSGIFSDKPHESVPGGHISHDVAVWMASLPVPEGPSFIFLHHPPYPYLGFPPLLFGLDEESTDLLTELATRVDAEAIFCGHTHRSALTYLNEVPVFEVPSTKEWPFGFGVIDVTKTDWAYNLESMTDQRLIEDLSGSSGALFRRYARGPDEARAYSDRLNKPIATG